MTDVKWIKVDIDLFENEKIMLIKMDEDADALILLWLRLLCLAGKKNNHGRFVMDNGLVYTPEIFASVLRCDRALVDKALKLFLEYGMLMEEDGILCIKNWDEYQDLDALERRRESDKLRKQKYRTKQREQTEERDCPEDGDGTETPCHVTEKRREEENRGEKSREDKRRGDAGIENKEKPKKEKFSFSGFAGGNTELLEALEAFEAMRKTIRKPMTDRAKEMLCAELKKYPEREWVPMLNQAVLNSWQSVYPLRQTGPGSSKAAAELEDFYAMTADWAGGGIHDEQ